MVYTFLTGGYSRIIYLDNNRTFESLKTEYIEPVKERASTDFDYGQIDLALEKGYISQIIYDETIALKTAIEPRNKTNKVI